MCGTSPLIKHTISFLFFFQRSMEGNCAVLPIRHGYGKDVSLKGDVYVGDWNQNKKHGYGKMTYRNGSVYEGTWRNDIYNGKGTLELW